jgi:hypothetical protein
VLKHALGVLFTSILALTAGAQIVWPPAVFTPAAPTSADVIRATFTVPGGCGVDAATGVEGSTIRTNVILFGCITGPPPIPDVYEVDFGPVRAGNYTYEVVFHPEGSPPATRLQQPLVVTAAPAVTPAIPAMSPTATPFSSQQLPAWPRS